MVHAIGVDHPPVQVDAEPHPNPLPVAATVRVMPTPMVSVSSPGPELEAPPMVSCRQHHITLMIVVANYCSLSRCLRTLLVLCLSSQMLAMSTCQMRNLL